MGEEVEELDEKRQAVMVPAEFAPSDRAVASRVTRDLRSIEKRVEQVGNIVVLVAPRLVVAC